MSFRNTALLYLAHSHSIYIFDTDAPERDYWQPQIVTRISDFISQGYVVVYVAEKNENSALRNFSRLGFPVEDFIESGALTIISKDVFYSPEISGEVLEEQWIKVFQAAEKKIGRENVKGYVGIGMPGDSFFVSDVNQQRLVQYENRVALNYKGSMEAMCCYTTAMLERMPLRYVVMLLNAHQNTAHRNGELRHWSVERCIEIIQDGLNEALGPGVSEMVFAILLKDFGMDKSTLVSAPHRFEAKLGYLLGASAADIVASKIKHEFTRAATY